MGKRNQQTLTLTPPTTLTEHKNGSQATRSQAPSSIKEAPSIQAPSIQEALVGFEEALVGLQGTAPPLNIKRSSTSKEALIDFEKSARRLRKKRSARRLRKKRSARRLRKKRSSTSKEALVDFERSARRIIFSFCYS